MEDDYMNIRKMYLPYSLAEMNLSRGIRQPILGQIQCLLKIKGFYQGIEQDTYTDEIGEAILQFQKSEKLVPTGSLDPITYCRLYGADIVEITSVKDNRHRADLTLARGRILIHKPTRQLTLFNGNNQLRSYPVAIGKPSTPTPEGDYAIATKILNPGGMLGTRWMGLNFDPNYGIHGNRAPWSIGQLVSLGCVRMHNHHVEELFTLVRVGTPVMIR
jgi:peptidoglycan hydrolase-like protein with peptidoglycan-binding domain